MGKALTLGCITGTGILRGEVDALPEADRAVLSTHAHAVAWQALLPESLVGAPPCLQHERHQDEMTSGGAGI